MRSCMCNGVLLKKDHHTLKTWKAHILIFLLESYNRCRLEETELQDRFAVHEKVDYLCMLTTSVTMYF